MAVAGSAAPSLQIHIEKLREFDGTPVDVIVITHSENRLTHMQVETGEFTKDGKPKTKRVPLKTIEHDPWRAVKRLLRGEMFYVRAQDFAEIKEYMNRESVPIQLLSMRYTRGEE